jgi:ribosomal protein S18 acetylase RimI-like enzyme
MAAPLDVRLATKADAASVATVIADAFDDDPIMRFIVPARDYRTRLTRLFRMELAGFLRLGSTWVAVDGDEILGAALWAPPDRWKQSPIDMARVIIPAMRVFGTSIRHGLAAFGALEKAHPERPPHWYLATIGTAAEHQGRGVGGALLRQVLDRCDRDLEPAYLESSKSENVPYYERFGFEVTGDIVLPDGGPTAIAMWRDPQPAPTR